MASTSNDTAGADSGGQCSRIVSYLFPTSEKSDFPLRSPPSSFSSDHGHWSDLADGELSTLLVPQPRASELISSLLSPSAGRHARIFLPPHRVHLPLFQRSTRSTDPPFRLDEERQGSDR